MATRKSKLLDHLEFAPSPVSSRFDSWVGAASFEERSVGSLKQLAASGAVVKKMTVFVYGTDLSPASQGEIRRNRVLASIDEIAEDLGVQSLEKVPLNAYSFGAAERVLEECLTGTDSIIDVTCLTKVHALAAATVLSKRTMGRAWVAYSIPDNYPGLNRSRRADGWRDIIVSPFSRTARFFNENSGRGIVILGHEADRLAVALAEIEPAGGSLLLCISSDRPDLAEVSRRRNRIVVRQLTAMRTADWNQRDIHLESLNEVSAIVEAETARARKDGAPVVLFPYGPKPVIFSACFKLALTYPENAWFVYPLPNSYDVNYSQGVSDVYWYLADRAANTLLQRAAGLLTKDR